MPNQTGIFPSTAERVCVCPAMIMRACALVEKHDLFRSQMPSGHAAVLDRIIKIVDCNDMRRGIYARRATLAAMSSRSEHQVKRALAWLEANGVITRCKLAHAGNRGSTSQIYFTDRALDMLQLSLPTPAELKTTILNAMSVKMGMFNTAELVW